MPFCIGVFSELNNPSEGPQGCFPKKMPNQRVCKGCFQNLMPNQRVCKGCLGKKHTSNVFLGEAFSQITLSRVVSRRFFFKNSIPICLEMLFSLGACCSFGCEKRRGSPRLILLVWSFSKLRVSAFQPCSVLSHSRH